jgi:hypothetical protein
MKRADLNEYMGKYRNRVDPDKLAPALEHFLVTGMAEQLKKVCSKRVKTTDSRAELNAAVARILAKNKLAMLAVMAYLDELAGDVADKEVKRAD